MAASGVIRLPGFLRFLLIMLLAFQIAAAAAQSPSDPLTGKPGDEPGLSVATWKGDWKDVKRSRLIPAKIYYPQNGAGPFPVIIFSHGLGSSRNGYEYLGRYWAECGYVSVHIQHLGSDTGVWKKANPRAAMRAAASDIRNAINRPLDVSFALDQLAMLNEQDGPFRGQLDLEKIGVAGHSFGAYTALAVAGQEFGPNITGFADARIKAVIAMSPPVPRQIDMERSFSKIKIPVMHMTGTKDLSRIGETTAKDRRVPFDNIKGVPQFLITLKGGTHLVFTGQSRLIGFSQTDEVFQSLIVRSSVIFWNAYLKKNSRSKEWLVRGGLKDIIGKYGTVEQKGL